MNQLEVFVGGRRYGKTHRTIQWLKEDPENRVILTVSEREAYRLRREYGLNEKQVVSVSTPQRLRGRPIVVGVDNVDLILQYMLGVPIGAMSATGAAETLNPDVVS